MDTLTLPPAELSTPGQEPLRKRRAARAIALFAVIVLALVTGFSIWFLSRTGPDEVDAETALTDVAGEEVAVTSTTDVSGTWDVSTDVAVFDVDATTGTFVGFRVAEELANLGAVDAVGRTGAVSGSVTIDGTMLVAGDITADVTQMVSNDSRREDNIAEALETTTFQTATFAVTESVDLGSDLADGETVTVDVPGTLTIHGVSQDVTVEMSVARTGDVVVVTGTTPITFSDVDVETPTSPAVVSLDDSGDIEFQLYLTQG